MLFILSILTYDFAKIINLLFDWWFCHMNRWPIRVVAFKWNICLQIELLCLYPRSSVNQKNNIIWVLHLNKWLSILDRVSGWGKSFVPPPPPPLPLPTYRAHCWSHVDAELCTVILPCYFSVKGHQNLFPTFFPLPCPRVLLFGLLVPHLYNVLGWKFLCSQCNESTLDKPMGMSKSHFHPYGICVSIAR